MTLMAVGSSGKPAKAIAVPALAVWLFVALVVLLISSASISYVMMSASLVHRTKLNEEKDAVIRELVARNHELRTVTGAQQSRMAYLSEQLQLMELKISAIGCLGEEIIATLGSDVELSSQLDLLSLSVPAESQLPVSDLFLGSGGVDRAVPDRLYADSPRTVRVSDLVSAKVEAMLSALAHDVEAFELLKSEAESYAHRMNHTPTEWPVTGPISSRYGTRVHPVYGGRRFHDGIDIAVSVGTPVRAAADGVVTWSGDKGGYGLTVIIDHGNGLETFYAHNSRLVAKRGSEVKKGQIIAYSGNTGVSTGPHLHYEVRKAGKSVDPMVYLD
jgi:murein DD-endopeptidase MepM/ murein hydrolase activator NlpD